MRSFSLTLALMMLSTPICAQTAPAIGAHMDQGDGDIIVTARKRQESILRVPVVETVLSGDMLEQAQIRSIADVTTKVPGLSLGASTLTIGTQVSLRGVGTTALDAGIDQSVSLNIDGLQLGQGIAFKSGVFDLGQAEVLKGPQALFYGKNSPAGVISLRTADPGADFELIGRTGYETEAHEWRNELILSGPVTPTLGLRLATMYSTVDGYYRNRAIANTALGGKQPRDDRYGHTKSLIMRGTALWKPIEAFEARLKVNYTRDRNRGGAVAQYVSCPEGVGAIQPFPGVPFLANEDCRVDRNVQIADLDPAAFIGVANNGVQFQNDGQVFGTLEMTGRLGQNLTLSSTTGYYRLRSAGLINAVVQPSIPALSTDNRLRRRDFTQEVRLESDFDSPLNFMIGGFYQDGRLSNRLYLLTNTILNRSLGLGAFIPQTLANQRSTLEIEAVSAFGQLRWQVVPTLELSGGIRWTDEKRTDKVVDLRSGAAIPIPNDRISSSNLSPEFTVTYTPTDDLTLFGSYKKGFKSGSFSVSRLITPGDDPSFGDESVSGGEVGLKSRMMDRALFLNLSGYYYTYKGLQVGVNRNEGVIPLNATLNAGAARVYGVDLDLSYRVPSVPGLSLRGALNWNRARFSRLDGVPCTGGQTIAEGCTQVPNLSGATGSTDPVTGAPLFTAQSLTGSSLVRAPRWQATAGADYSVDVGSAYTLRLGVDAQYSSRFKTQLSSRSDAIQPGYAKLNANLSFGARDERWQFSLIGNNLTDKLTYGNCINANLQNGGIYGAQITGGSISGPAGRDELICFMDRGRELWARVAVKF